jgi:hypothetical protein
VAIVNNRFFLYPRSANGVAPASLTAPYPAAIEALYIPTGKKTSCM